MTLFLMSWRTTLISLLALPLSLLAGILVLRASGGGVRVLLTADAESDVLAPIAPGSVDVLKASHHGSEDEGV